MDEPRFEAFGRYSRQRLFGPIGDEGQERLSRSLVVVVGCGALGSVLSATMVRAGVGKVRVIDRDFVEEHNLHRQLLFTEQDVKEGTPKATAAQRHLLAANSHVTVEGIVADFSPDNAERLVTGADIILDGLDNFESRFIVNDVALKLGITWVYGGAIGSVGMTSVFRADRRPCFRCLMNDAPTLGGLTCDTVGVIAPTPLTVAALQSAAALRILVGEDIGPPRLTFLDVWEQSFTTVELDESGWEGCPACAGEYEYLEGAAGSNAAGLCGQNAVQLYLPSDRPVDLEVLADRLRRFGEVAGDATMARLTLGGHEIVVFYDGRVIVRGTSDPAVARSLVAKYVGM
jgi:adenylyltransferase/sulfurtransferase